MILGSIRSALGSVGAQLGSVSASHAAAVSQGDVVVHRPFRRPVPLVGWVDVELPALLVLVSGRIAPTTTAGFATADLALASIDLRGAVVPTNVAGDSSIELRSADLMPMFLTISKKKRPS